MKPLPKILSIILLFFIFSLWSVKIFACNPPQSYIGCLDNPDNNFGERGYTKTEGGLNRYSEAHPIDLGAPQLTTLLDETLPPITGIGNVNRLADDHAESWSPEGTMIFLGAKSGETVYVPASGYGIGGNYEAVVLYADSNRVTLKYTIPHPENPIGDGYTVYIEGVDINPEIISLYQQSISKEGQLPAVSAHYPIGTVTESGEVGVAIRDTGAFLDVRWQEWWEKKIEKGEPVPPEIIDILSPALGPSEPGTVSPITPSPTPPPIICKNPNAEDGSFRPYPCEGCGEDIEPQYLETSCATTFEAKQNTFIWVDTKALEALDNGEEVTNIGAISLCDGGKGNPFAYFTETWGGKVEFDISESKVPFASYKDYVPQHESKYLATYLAGTVTITGSQLTPEFTGLTAEQIQREKDIYGDEGAKARDAFRRGGVIPRILAKDKLDRLRCTRIRKTLNGTDYDYEAGNSGKHLSDFFNNPPYISKITSDVELNSPWCVEPKPPSLPSSNDPEAWENYQNLLQEYKQERSIWEDKRDEWLETDLADAWAYIPLTTLKDAPGYMQTVPTYKESSFSFDSGGTMAYLSIPHMASLYEATKIVHEVLTPKYPAGSLAPQTTSQEQGKTLLASSNSVIARIPLAGDEAISEIAPPSTDTRDRNDSQFLDQLLDQSQSACGYQEVLGEKTTLLAQAEEASETSEGYLTVKIEIEKVEGGFVYYGVRIIQNGPKKGHQAVNGRDIGPAEPPDSGYYLSSQDPNWSDVLPPAKINADGSFEIPQVHTWNHQMTNEAWMATRDMTASCQGEVNENGEIEQTNCETKPFEPENLKRKGCYNKIRETPYDCYDPSALEDSNPNDVICSNPFPLTGQLLNKDYRTPVSREQLEALVADAEDCIQARGCNDMKNKKKKEHCAISCSQRYIRAIQDKAEMKQLTNEAKARLGLTETDYLAAELHLRPYLEGFKSNFYMTAPLQIKLYLPYTEFVGEHMLSDYYRYLLPPGSKGEFEENPYQSVGGIFDVFRPAQMNHFKPLEARTSIGYQYQGTYSDYFDINTPSVRGLSKAAVADSLASPSKGEIYFPWLGGTNKAKQCVSQVMLLPYELTKEQIVSSGLCPGFEGDELGGSSNQARTILSTNEQFQEEEKEIKTGAKDNPTLPYPEEKPVHEPPKTREEVENWLKENTDYEPYIIERIAANFSAYWQAQEETGIPWYIFTSIHGVESNFRPDNPNSYGPMQVVGSEHPAGRENSFEEFVAILVEAGGVIQRKAEIAKSLDWIEKMPETKQEWLEAAPIVSYLYNGAPKETTCPENNKTYYGRDKDSWQNSPYVTNLWPKHQDKDFQEGNTYVLWWDGSWVPMSQAGVMFHLENLKTLISFPI